MKFGKEHTPVPGGEPKRLGAGLTPEMVAPWGLVVGKKIELKTPHLPVEGNPFTVVTVGFKSDQIAFGVVIRSDRSQKMHILVPKDNGNIERIVSCTEGESAQALEYEDPPFGEAISYEGKE